jgi:hypothetical protein
MIITRTEFFLLPTTNKKKITPSVQASSNCRKKNWLFVLPVCRVGVLMTIASIFFLLNNYQRPGMFFLLRGNKNSNGPCQSNIGLIIWRVMNENLKKKRKEWERYIRQSNEREGGKNHKRAKRVINQGCGLASYRALAGSAFKRRSVTELRHQQPTAFWPSGKGGANNQLVAVLRSCVCVCVCVSVPLLHTHISKCPNRERRKKIDTHSQREKSSCSFILSWYSRDCARGRDAIEFSTHRISTDKKEKKK